MVEKQESILIDQVLEELMDLCYLYLKLGENTKDGSVVTAFKNSKYVEPILDAIIAREEVLKRIKLLLQYLHRL